MRMIAKAKMSKNKFSLTLMERNINLSLTNCDSRHANSYPFCLPTAKEPCWFEEEDKEENKKSKGILEL